MWYPCCSPDSNTTVVCGGTCNVCGNFDFSNQTPNSRLVWKTSDGSFVPATVIVSLNQSGSDNNAVVQFTVTTMSGSEVSNSIPRGNSFAETFPAIKDLTIEIIAGNNAVGEFCICVGSPVSNS
ncbi:S-Ena type endospore appendage [Bacillus sp. 165]|uniref:S-Ena type endospore appendage n=1 Tax=Bacillus sp. 165 TaxID=1529117 RepID=UPI001ADB7D9E|nr:S-Ena type endospore appendage [Bacillus sp. 165]MBO9129853.1 hypothetical protein [Bacillus sp. 165]